MSMRVKEIKITAKKRIIARFFWTICRKKVLNLSFKNKMDMNTTMKNVLIVLVAVVSSGLTIGANAYMNRQHANVATCR